MTTKCHQNITTYTKSCSHTPMIEIVLNFRYKKILPIFVKKFWQADLVLNRISIFPLFYQDLDF